MRLIDADALTGDFENDLLCLCLDGEKGTPRIEINIRNVFERIESAPTIEAEPIRRGEWKTKVAYWHECSLCGAISQDRENYCPNCGAKMDGGKDEGGATPDE